MSGPGPRISAEDIGVSRETFARLEAYVALLIKWNRRINLIGPCPADQVWFRHILDCAQLNDHAPATGEWADIGSGGGLPGLVIAALRQGAPGHSITLFESDARKCAFLKEAARMMAVDVEIRQVRVETVARKFDIISARAFAPLPRLLDLSDRMVKPSTVFVLPKGRRASEEIELARKRWNFKVKTFASRTSDESAILRIEDVIHV